MEGEVLRHNQASAVESTIGRVLTTMNVNIKRILTRRRAYPLNLIMAIVPMPSIHSRWNLAHALSLIPFSIQTSGFYETLCYSIRGSAFWLQLEFLMQQVKPICKAFANKSSFVHVTLQNTWGNSGQKMGAQNRQFLWYRSRPFYKDLPWHLIAQIVASAFGSQVSLL